MGGGLRLFGEDSPVIETSAGKIQGLLQGKSYTFKGVPYGASTAGAGRFMPPVKPQPWKDVKLRSMHTMDVGFVFDNVDIAKSELGEGKDRQPLADKMSAAWVAFAKTGNPNHKGIPNWTPFNSTQRTTMVFNNECKVVNDPYKEERLAVAEAASGRQNEGA